MQSGRLRRALTVVSFKRDAAKKAKGDTWDWGDDRGGKKRKKKNSGEGWEGGGTCACVCDNRSSASHPVGGAGRGTVLLLPPRGAVHT